MREVSKIVYYGIIQKHMIAKDSHKLIRTVTYFNEKELIVELFYVNGVKLGTAIEHDGTQVYLLED